MRSASLFTTLRPASTRPWIGLLVLALCGPPQIRGQEAAPADESPVCEESFFDSDGVDLRYLDCGAGDPVILLHGFALTAEMNWAPTGLFESLPAAYRLLALDQRGHGRSGKPHGPEAYGSAFAEDVLRLMDHLEIESAYLVGYSMGGRIALKLMAEHPDRVRAAVLGGQGWRPPGSGLPESVRHWVAALEEISDAGGSVTDALWLPDWPPPTPEMRAGLDANDPEALLAMIRGMAGLDVTAESLEANQVPTLAVFGEEDWVRPAVEALAEIKPDVRIVVLPGRSHASALADPGLAGAVLEFLREQP